MGQREEPGRRWWAALAVPVAVLAACGSGGGDDRGAATPAAAAAGPAAAAPAGTEVTYPVELTDAMGVVHTVAAPLERVGCLWYGCTEMMADLGLAPAAASVTPEETTSAFMFPAGPPEVRIDDFTDVEAWAAAEVEMIFHRGQETPESQALEQVAPVFYFHAFGEAEGLDGLAAYEENLRILGLVTGEPERAEAAVARFGSVLDRMAELAPADAVDTSVAALLAGDGYLLTPPDGPFCEALTQGSLGGCVEVPGFDAETWEVNGEALLAADPDWIAYQTFDDTQSIAGRSDPIWGQLPAVQAGRAYDAGSRYYCCSLRGLVHSLQEYGHHAFPEAGIPDPGPVDDFDPLTSPLARAA